VINFHGVSFGFGIAVKQPVDAAESRASCDRFTGDAVVVFRNNCWSVPVFFRTQVDKFHQIPSIHATAYRIKIHLCLCLNSLFALIRLYGHAVVDA
jgi:hypothetical protein